MRRNERFDYVEPERTHTGSTDRNGTGADRRRKWRSTLRWTARRIWHIHALVLWYGEDIFRIESSRIRMAMDRHLGKGKGKGKGKEGNTSFHVSANTKCAD